MWGKKKDWSIDLNAVIQAFPFKGTVTEKNGDLFS